MNKSASYLSLLKLVVKHGSLQYRQGESSLKRKKSIENLQAFIPDSYAQPSSHQSSTVLAKLMAQAAYVRSSMNVKGGHLAAGEIAYIRIPKAANTSAGLMMLQRKYPELRRHAVTEEQVNFLTDVNLEHAISGKTQELFTFVRNPFHRIVSVYRDCVQQSEQFIYSDYLFGILNRNLSFGEFVNRVSNIPDRLKDQHLKPQHTFLEYYEKRGLSVKVLPLEKPEAIQTYLHGHGLQLPHLNTSGSYDYRSYYTPETISLVEEIYRYDIEKFGYQQLVERLRK